MSELNPAEWTSETWTVVGVLVAILFPLLGFNLHRRSARQQDEPHIVFSPLEFQRPGEHPREQYPFAIAVRIWNAGPGPALHVSVAVVDSVDDPDEIVYAELLTRPVLAVGDTTADFLGLRGRERDEDISEGGARDFFDRCFLVVHCWDRRNRQWVFTPAGVQRIRKRHSVNSPQEMMQGLPAFPSRGDARRSFGFGSRTDR
jgi:hypothetical protein